jgi:hypothetical protein
MTLAARVRRTALFCSPRDKRLTRDCVPFPVRGLAASQLSYQRGASSPTRRSPRHVRG